MSWKRTIRKARRIIILLAILGGIGFSVYWIVTNGERIRDWSQGKTPGKKKTRNASNYKKPDPIEEGVYVARNGMSWPGVLQLRLDIPQFVQLGLAKLSGNNDRDDNLDLLFDESDKTPVEFNLEGPAYVVVEFKNAQNLTGFDFVPSGKNSGKWRIEAMVERKDQLGNVTHTSAALGEGEYEPGLPIVVKLPDPVLCRSLRLFLEKDAPDEKLWVRNWGIFGLVQLKTVAISAEDRFLKIHRSEPCRLLVKDTNGLAIDLPDSVEWHSSNPGVAQVDANQEIRGLKEGQTSIVASLYGVKSNALSCVVVSPKDSPTGIMATPMHSKIYLEWAPTKSEFLAHYRVYRRTERGEYTDKYRGKTFQSSFTDENLLPGQTYYYRVEAFDLEGERISSPSEEIQVTTSKQDTHYSTIPSTDILVLLYREGLNDYQIKQRKRGLDAAKLFYYRNTKGRLLFNMVYYEIYAKPPKTADPDPDHPTMKYIGLDCLKRGVEQGQFDIIYATGRGLCGCWGGFGILGGRGAFGDAASVPYPTRDLEIDRAMIWSFAHECHHAFDGVCDTAGPVAMYGCHFYDNFPLTQSTPIDAGSHYDGIADIMRRYPGYELREPFKQEIEFLDFDKDGFPDNDPRFPMDEERFGSRTDTPDTDGDGLTDLEEFYAGVFKGSDPNNIDTDGDGIKDGDDKYPIYNVVEKLAYYPAGHEIDGILEPAWSKFSEGLAFHNDPDLKVRTYMNYNDDYLYIAFESSKRLKAFIEIDGSGEDGRWASNHRYEGSDNKLPKLSKSDSYSEDAALVVEAGKKYVSLGGERMDHMVEGSSEHAKERLKQMGVETGKGLDTALVAWGTRNQKTSNNYGHILEVRIPRTLPPGAAYTWFSLRAEKVDGLQFKPGQVMGFNFYVGEEGKIGDSQYSGVWGNVFETYHFVDVTLSGYEDMDEDGLNAYDESRLGTDPMNADTDGDGTIDSRDSTPTTNLFRN